MSSGHDSRQRASICQDCWFWKEMSCALPNPADDVCANKRPVQGRRVGSPRPIGQAQLTPLAAGHEMAPAAAVIPTVAPFATDAPESTFSMAQLRVVETTEPADEPAPVPRVHAAPPSFREIRSGRAAAASRAPVAAVRIPIEELEAGTLVADAARHARVASPVATALPGMDQLVERVRQRTAARLSRGGVASNS